MADGRCGSHGGREVNPETASLIARITLVVSWVGLVALTCHAIYWQHRYQKAWRETAAKLCNVTTDRDKLHIQNAGLKQELTRECVKNERLEEEVARYRADNAAYLGKRDGL